MEKKNIFSVWFWLITALCVLFSAMCIGTYGTVKMPSSYYQTANWDGGEYDAVVFKLTLNESAKPTSVWVKLAGVADGSSALLNLSTSTSQTTGYSNTYGAGEKSISKTAENFSAFKKVWSITSTSTSRVYYQLATKSDIKIEEIVVLDENNDKVKLEVLYSGPTSSVTDKLNSALTSSKYPERIEQAKKLIDEQDYFDNANVVDGVYQVKATAKFTEKEMATLDSVRNILARDGAYLDNSANPLGLQLISLGVAIFGQNTFGLRVIPFLFAVATIIAVYLLGKKLFNKQSLGFILALIYAISGFSIANATHGTVISTFVFFAVMSLYFMVCFYKRGVNYYAKVETLSPLALSGLFFALAFATMSQALYLLAVLTALLVITIIRTVQVNKAKIATKTSKDDIWEAQYILKRKISLTIVVYLISFVFVTALISSICYLISLPVYTAIFGDNFINVMGSSFGGIKTADTTTYASVNSSNIVQYLINFKAEQLSSSKYVTGNLVLSFTSLFSLIYSTSYVLSIALSKDELKKDKEYKKNVLTPYIILITIFVLSFVLTLFNESKAISTFSFTSVSYYAFTVLAYSIIKGDDKTKLLTKGKTVIKVTDLIFVLIIIFATVLLGFNLVRLVGISLTSYPLSFLSIRW